MGINMGKGVVEERGRVLIPKDIREELNLKPGQEVLIEKKEGFIVIRPAIDVKKLTAELRGCVKKPKVHPRDVKHIWHM